MKMRQVAFVTGASRGIGRAVALSLAGAGFDCILAARSVYSLEVFWSETLLNFTLEL